MNRSIFDELKKTSNQIVLVFMVICFFFATGYMQKFWQGAREIVSVSLSKSSCVSSENEKNISVYMNQAHMDIAEPIIHVTLTSSTNGEKFLVVSDNLSLKKNNPVKSGKNSFFLYSDWEDLPRGEYKIDFTQSRFWTDLNHDGKKQSGESIKCKIPSSKHITLEDDEHMKVDLSIDCHIK